MPTFQPSTPVPERLEAVQRYIRELQYPPGSRVMAISGWLASPKAEWGLLAAWAGEVSAEHPHSTAPWVPFA